jgi:hypothetical protein
LRPASIADGGSHIETNEPSAVWADPARSGNEKNFSKCYMFNFATAGRLRGLPPFPGSKKKQAIGGRSARRFIVFHHTVLCSFRNVLT